MLMVIRVMLTSAVGGDSDSDNDGDVDTGNGENGDNHDGIDNDDERNDYVMIPLLLFMIITVIIMIKNVDEVK